MTGDFAQVLGRAPLNMSNSVEDRIYFRGLLIYAPTGQGAPMNDNCGGSCGPDEPWVYGETAYEAIRHVVSIRESLDNYVQEQYKTQSQTGKP